MKKEEIIKHLERRNQKVMCVDLVSCAEFIMEHKDRVKFEKEILN